MSVEAGISQGAGLSEGFSPSASFNLDKGGSFSSGLNAQSLFSETSSFTPSLGPVSEGPVSKDIFVKSEWTTLAETKPGVKPDFSMFEPFAPKDLSSAEKKADFKIEEFTVLAKNTGFPQKNTVSKLLRETKPAEVFLTSFDKRIEFNPSELETIAEVIRE